MPNTDRDKTFDSKLPRRVYNRPGRRKWYRQHFYDHPGYNVRDPTAMAGTGKTHDKVKVWCKRCFAYHLELAKASAKAVGDERDEQDIVEDREYQYHILR